MGVQTQRGRVNPNVRYKGRPLPMPYARLQAGDYRWTEAEVAWCHRVGLTPDAVIGRGAKMTRDDRNRWNSGQRRDFPRV